MRRFMVHFVTEIDFVDGDEASEDVVRIARSVSRRQFRRRPRALLAPDVKAVQVENVVVEEIKAEL
jgi:hypothetical protein